MMRAILMGFFLFSSTAIHADEAVKNGLCIAPEIAFFSCQTVQKKWIGICGVLPKNLQYRFGRQDAIELSYPEQASSGVNSFRFTHYARFQTERVELTFSNHGIDYAVFDYAENSARRAGVRVTALDGKESEIRCSARIKSRLMELQNSVRCDVENALNGGRCHEKEVRDGIR